MREQFCPQWEWGGNFTRPMDTIFETVYLVFIFKCIRNKMQRAHETWHFTDIIAYDEAKTSSELT